MFDYSKMSEQDFKNYLDGAKNRLERRNPGDKVAAAELKALKAEFDRRAKLPKLNEKAQKEKELAERAAKVAADKAAHK